MTCATCKHATAVTPGDIDHGRPIGYFACALQTSWRYFTYCNINKHEVKHGSG